MPKVYREKEAYMVTQVNKGRRVIQVNKGRRVILVQRVIQV